MHGPIYHTYIPECRSVIYGRLICIHVCFLKIDVISETYRSLVIFISFEQRTSEEYSKYFLCKSSEKNSCVKDSTVLGFLSASSIPADRNYFILTSNQFRLNIPTSKFKKFYFKNLTD